MVLKVKYHGPDCSDNKCTGNDRELHDCLSISEKEGAIEYKNWQRRRLKKKISDKNKALLSEMMKGYQQ